MYSKSRQKVSCKTIELLRFQYYSCNRRYNEKNNAYDSDQAKPLQDPYDEHLQQDERVTPFFPVVLG